MGRKGGGAHGWVRYVRVQPRWHVLEGMRNLFLWRGCRKVGNGVKRFLCAFLYATFQVVFRKIKMFIDAREIFVRCCCNIYKSSTIIKKNCIHYSTRNNFNLYNSLSHQTHVNKELTGTYRHAITIIIITDRFSNQTFTL